MLSAAEMAANLNGQKLQFSLTVAAILGILIALVIIRAFWRGDM